MPFLYIKEDYIDTGGYMDEQETEYNLLKNGSECVIRKSKLGDSQIYIPIDITKLPHEITMSYIEQEYGEDPMDRKLTPSKD